MTIRDERFYLYISKNMTVANMTVVTMTVANINVEKFKIQNFEFRDRCKYDRY